MKDKLQRLQKSLTTFKTLVSYTILPVEVRQQIDEHVKKIDEILDKELSKNG